MRLIDKARALIAPPPPSVPNPRDSDIYLVSYPKSGNTWMRYLLAYAIWPETRELDLRQMAAYVPSYGLAEDIQAMLNPDAPCNRVPHRIIKEHFAYGRVARRYAKRAIYIARDGRDALVSYWHFCNQRDGTDIPFSDFIRLSADVVRYYGPWRKHVTGWLAAPIKHKLVLRYEDLQATPERCLAQALEFAGIPASPGAIADAVERASFKEMRKLEEKKGFNLDQLKNVNFVRKGKVGGWQDVFGDGDLEAFRIAHGHGIPELGYSW